MTNYIVNGLPRAVRIADEEVEIRTGFRRGIQFFLLAESENLDDVFFVQRVNEMYYMRDGILSDAVLDDELAAFEAAYEFWLNGQIMGVYETPGKKSKRRMVKTFDWTADTGILAADFRREYNIDLFTAQMHWYEFMALFNGLSDKALIVDAIGARSTDKTSDMSKAERKYLQAKKRRYQLRQARRTGVSRAEDAAIWGD